MLLIFQPERLTLVDGGIANDSDESDNDDARKLNNCKNVENHKNSLRLVNNLGEYNLLRLSLNLSRFLGLIQSYSKGSSISRTTLCNDWKTDLAGTAKRKLERLQFSTSSSFVKIWSACSCEFKAYFWTFWAL